MMTLYHLLGEPFGYVMRFIYEFVPNYGWAIFLFTLLTRIILFPVGYKQMKNTARMSLLNPKLAKIRKAYANNQQKIQEEQMKLYQEEHVNPMSSCLPMLLQFIILFGVLDVVYRPLHHILRISNDVISRAANAVVDTKIFSQFTKAGQLRDELYILSATQNSKGLKALNGIEGLNIDQLDKFYDNFQVFGVHLGMNPSIHPASWTYETIMLALIPIIAGLLQLALTILGQINVKRNNPDAKAGMRGMNFMMYIMPLFSVWFAYVVPAGVGFYWICSSLFSLIQTIGLNLYFTPERSEKIALKERDKARAKAKKGKKSMYQRMMESQSSELSQHRIESEEAVEGMSRKQVSKYNSEKVNKARNELMQKYGDTDNVTEKSDEDTYESEALKKARERMAKKYGDRIDV